LLAHEWKQRMFLLLQYSSFFSTPAFDQNFSGILGARVLADDSGVRSTETYIFGRRGILWEMMFGQPDVRVTSLKGPRPATHASPNARLTMWGTTAKISVGCTLDALFGWKYVEYFRLPFRSSPGPRITKQPPLCSSRSCQKKNAIYDGHKGPVLSFGTLCQLWPLSNAFLAP
jgi:hypothetical protein